MSHDMTLYLLIKYISVLNVAQNHRDIVFAAADEDEQVELVKLMESNFL